MIKNFIAEIIHVTKRLKARSIEVEEELVTKTLGSENLLANKDLIVNEDSDLKGNVDIGKNLTVKGTSTLKDNVIMEKALTANGNIVIGGTSTLKNNVVAEKTLTVNGTSTLKDNVTAEKNVLTKGNLTVNGTSTLEDNVTVNKSLTVKGDISVSGKISGIGFFDGEILSGGNNYAGLDKYNNIAIKSWWGISFSTSCTGQKFSSTPAVSIDCRDGHIYTGGNLNVSGSINVAYPHSIAVKHVDSSNNGDLYLNYNNSSEQKRVYFGTGDHCIRSNGAYYTGKSEDSYHLEGKGLTTNANPWNGIPVVDDNGVVEIGRYIDFHTQNENKDYDGRLEYNENGLVLNGDTIIDSSGVLKARLNYITYANLDGWQGAVSKELFSDFSIGSVEANTADRYMLMYAAGCSSTSSGSEGTDDRFTLYFVTTKVYGHSSSKSFIIQLMQLANVGDATRFGFVREEGSNALTFKVPNGSRAWVDVWEIRRNSKG